jgi:hypothetical protein
VTAVKRHGWWPVRRTSATFVSYSVIMPIHLHSVPFGRYFYHGAKEERTKGCWNKRLTVVTYRWRHDPRDYKAREYAIRYRKATQLFSTQVCIWTRQPYAVFKPKCTLPCWVSNSIAAFSTVKRVHFGCVWNVSAKPPPLNALAIYLVEVFWSAG